MGIMAVVQGSLGGLVSASAVGAALHCVNYILVGSILKLVVYGTHYMS